MKAPELRSVLAKNLKAALVRKRKSVVTVADFAGVSVAHLYDILACRKAATVDMIEKLASALGVEAAGLLAEGLATGPAAPAPRGKKKVPANPGAMSRSRESRPRAASSRSRG